MSGEDQLGRTNLHPPNDERDRVAEISGVAPSDLCVGSVSTTNGRYDSADH